MSTKSLQEVAELLLREAGKNGATAADVVVAEGDSLSVGVRLGSVEKVKRARARHLGLRVFVGERSAITSTADFSRDALSKLAAESVALAGVTAPDPFCGLPEQEDLSSVTAELELYDEAVAEVTPEQATGWCKVGEAAALGVDARITKSEGAEFDGGTYEIVYAATNGFSGAYRSSSCSLSVVPVATQDGAMQRDYWYSRARRLAELESPEAVGRTAATRTLRRLGARKVPTCEVPVVFDSETAATLLGHLAGAVSGDALYRGTSFLAGKLGERLAPSYVSIYDDGTLIGGLGSKPFDGEGVRTRRTPVIESGVLRSYLFDSYSGRKMQKRTTGNAARSIADAPRVSPSNLFFQPGHMSPEEIIGSVARGLYVTELLGFGVNPVTGDYSRGAAGLWIQNGEPAYAVEEVTVAGNLLEMLRNIEAVGDDLSHRRALCAPTLKIASLTVAGS